MGFEERTFIKARRQNWNKTIKRLFLESLANWRQLESFQAWDTLLLQFKCGPEGEGHPGYKDATLIKLDLEW